MTVAAMKTQDRHHWEKEKKEEEEEKIRLQNQPTITGRRKTHTRSKGSYTQKGLYRFRYLPARYAEDRDYGQYEELNEKYKELNKKNGISF